jgi:sugar phosphate isomerase/epimerase
MDRFSVCELSTPDTTFEQDLDLIRARGARGIAIAEEKLRRGDEEAQLAALRDSGLSATVCIPTNIGPMSPQPALIYEGPQDPETRVSLMCDSVRRLAPFEPDAVVVITGSSAGRDGAEARKIAIDGLRIVAETAQELGLRLALEPCRRNAYDGSFVHTLSGALALVDEIDRPNVGICYDVYHLWDEEDILALTEQHATRVFGVQVADWREPPRSFADRLFPGDGQIDLPSMIGALERGGFEGWYDVELFSDDGRWGTDLPDSIWKLPAQEIVRRGVDGLERVWDAYRSASR